MSGGAHGAQLARLVRRLVDEGVVDAESALEGRVTVTDLSRSNAVGLVLVDGQPVVVLKGGRISPAEPDWIAAEAAAYRWLAASPATSRLVPSPLPDVLPGEAILTRPLPHAVSLHEALRSEPDRSDALVAELGSVLGRLHGAAPAGEAPGSLRPWILDVPSGRVPAMYASNPPARSKVDEIARHRATAAAIAAFDRRWTTRCVIHGDVKFDNVLIAPDRVVLVDWELAALGDPAWDLAGVVDGLILPLRVSGEGPAVDEALVARLAAPALAAHRAAAGPGASPSPAKLALAVVARLAQTATQLAAMAHEHADAADAATAVLAAATELAGELVHTTTPLCR